ncbi:hypothetical protein PF011_g32356 [Phytophthora fragariae]|uniref:Peptidase A2 domain-containing protein n=1 Tax=Phytophthora fragariae TaxID=53985 RepID=A0A6A3GAJ6_9STRA|nr:hypothetical protein PF011_g32356 [Phytophthora fragariae]
MAVRCLLSHSPVIDDRKVHCFVDSGSSFNAISPNLAEKLNLTVEVRSKPLTVNLGNDQQVTIPRRVASVDLVMDGFPAYHTSVYVMPIPEGKDVLLG